MADQLSPSDQVMIAVAHVYQEHGGEPPARAVAAAALRAAADQVVPPALEEEFHDRNQAPPLTAMVKIRQKLLAIVAKLEA